jgi:hypothetical protein
MSPEDLRMIRQTKELPTTKDIITVLNDLIESEENGNREADGVIRDAQSLNVIECLKAAIQVIRSGAKTRNRAHDGKERSKR